MQSFSLLTSFLIFNTHARMFSVSKEKQGTLSVIVGVGVVVRNQNGEILMKKRNGSHGQGEWALVGGKIDFGETFEEAAYRELKEETGLVGKKPRVVSLSNQLRYLGDGVHCVIIGVELDISVGAEPENLEPEKCDGFDWVSENALPDSIFEGSRQILDALSNGRKIAYVGN